MRVVKNEYDVCTKRYQATMASIHEPAHSTQREQRLQREHQLQMRERQLYEQQLNLWQQRNGTHASFVAQTTSTTTTTSTDSEQEQQEEGIKAVCW